MLDLLTIIYDIFHEIDPFESSPAFNHMRMGEWQSQRKPMKNNKNTAILTCKILNVYDLYASTVLSPHRLSIIGNKLSFPPI